MKGADVQSGRHWVREITPEVEWSEVKRSRHTRRRALQKQFEMKQEGWVMLMNTESEFTYAFRRFRPDFVTIAPTQYVGHYKPSYIRGQTWWKSPIAGVSVGQIFSLAQLRFHYDPEEMYRAQYEMRRVLESDAATILTDLMMYELGMEQ